MLKYWEFIGWKIRIICKLIVVTVTVHTSSEKSSYCFALVSNFWGGKKSNIRHSTNQNDRPRCHIKSLRSFPLQKLSLLTKQLNCQMDIPGKLSLGQIRSPGSFLNLFYFLKCERGGWFYTCNIKLLFTTFKKKKHNWTELNLHNRHVKKKIKKTSITWSKSCVMTSS